MCIKEQRGSSLIFQHQTIKVNRVGKTTERVSENGPQLESAWYMQLAPRTLLGHVTSNSSNRSVEALARVGHVTYKSSHVRE